jgi:predicted membrane channel-forming protein YqfA (hemolysin III family)
MNLDPSPLSLFSFSLGMALIAVIIIYVVWKRRGNKSYKAPSFVMFIIYIALGIILSNNIFPLDAWSHPINFLGNSVFYTLGIYILV